MRHQYTNHYLLSRIAGGAFDLMVIAGICAIEFDSLMGLWLPFILLCCADTIGTLWYLQWMCKRLYADYYYEGLLSMFGMMTGTISLGVLLLRELDPFFKTPASNNLLNGASIAIVFGIPMLVFVGLVPKSWKLLLLTMALCVVYFIALLWIMLKAKR